MKKIYTLLLAVIITTLSLAQAPQKMSYQAVIRNASDQLVTDQEVGIRISILQNSINGTLVYQEIYNPNPKTNINGLLTIEIGAGVPLTGKFSEIDWSDGPYFLKTETDPSGGTSYTITGTSQLLSVPYALHSSSSDVLSGEITESQISDLQNYLTGETDPVFEASPAAGIEAADIDNWNEAHSWGDHAVEDYLTEETDPSVPTGTQTGQMQYWDGSAWITVAVGNEDQVLTFVGGIPIWKTQGEVENPTTGNIWMDRNLGALRVAGSSTDADAYGDLYQWGRAGDGHQLRTSGTTSTTSSSDTPGHGNFIITTTSPYDWRSTQNDNLWQGVNGTNNPCPSGYRLPTEAEWNAERLSWSSNNAAGAFASPLKLPLAGVRSGSNGSLIDVGSDGVYWSSTVDFTYSRSLGFFSHDAFMFSHLRAYGNSVRCLKDD